MLPKRVNIGLTIGMRLIKCGKSKKAMTIHEIKRRSTYLSRAIKVRTNRGFRRRLDLG